jgi:hypothetical protein
MSFIDSIKYIERLSVVDEFGGRGGKDKISKIYICLKVTNENGEPIEISFGDIKNAATEGKIVVSDYMGVTNYDVGINKTDNSQFIVSDAVYKWQTNIITLEPVKFSGNISLCVKFRNENNDKNIITSTCYLSDFPSAAYFSKSST